MFVRIFERFNESKAAKRDLGSETLTIESSKSNDEQRRPLWPGKVVGSMEGRRDCPQLHDSIGISRHMQSDSCGSRTRDFSHCVRPCVFLLLFFFLLIFQFFLLSFFLTICYCCNTIACIAIVSSSYFIELPARTSTRLPNDFPFIYSFGFVLLSSFEE